VQGNPSDELPGNSSDTLPDPGSQANELRRDDELRDDLGGEAGIDDPQGEAEIDIASLANLANTAHLKVCLEFISTLRGASLNDLHNRLDEDALERLRNPIQEVLTVDDPDLRLAIDLFLATTNSSDQIYNLTREAILRRHPDHSILSHYQIKRRIADLTGVESITHDMCINSCLAYTGPFADLETCPKCGESRYDQVKLAASGGKIRASRQDFLTIPLGPQLQALWRDPESAERMRYRDKRTQDALDELQRNGVLESYDDFFQGKDYLNAVSEGKIGSGDMVLMLSIDGAQLYRNKSSDCWIYIWVVFDHAPDLRYKKKYVLIGGFIPGPNKPKVVDSFLFPGLHHLAAIQKEGLRIWDSSRDRIFTSCPFLALSTADGPGMVHLNGLVGYHGKHGCRLYCGLQGRHKPGGSHYFPALLKPNNYTMPGCDHDDIDARHLHACSTHNYSQNLRRVLSSSTNLQGEGHRKRGRYESFLVSLSLSHGYPFSLLEEDWISDM
jgi:hypothetical protein